MCLSAADELIPHIAGKRNVNQPIPVNVPQFAIGSEERDSAKPMRPLRNSFPAGHGITNSSLRVLERHVLLHVVMVLQYITTSVVMTCNDKRRNKISHLPLAGRTLRRLGGMRLKPKTSDKTPLDFIEPREELTPVQVRLPKNLLAQVKSKLEKNGLTFTDLVRGACWWYLEVADTPDGLLLKKKPR